MIPRKEAPYVQAILKDRDIPAWRKAELIIIFDGECRDAERRRDGAISRWTPTDVSKLEAEIKGMEG